MTLAEELWARHGWGEVSDTLPVLPMQDVVVCPKMWLPIMVGQARSLRLVEEAMAQSRLIACAASRDVSVEEPAPAQIYDIGTIVLVHHLLKNADGSVRLMVQGLERIRLREYVQEDPYLRARAELHPENTEESADVEAAVQRVQTLFRQFVEQNDQVPNDLIAMAEHVETPLQLTYLVAAALCPGLAMDKGVSIAEAQAILALDTPHQKLLHLETLLATR